MLVEGSLSFPYEVVIAVSAFHVIEHTTLFRFVCFALHMCQFLAQGVTGFVEYFKNLCCWKAHASLGDTLGEGGSHIHMVVW